MRKTIKYRLSNKAGYKRPKCLYGTVRIRNRINLTAKAYIDCVPDFCLEFSFAEFSHPHIDSCTAGVQDITALTHKRLCHLSLSYILMILEILRFYVC